MMIAALLILGKILAVIVLVILGGIVVLGFMALLMGMHIPERKGASRPGLPRGDR